MIEAIESFQGPYRWLSNFWPARVVLDGEVFSSVEHAYQAAKFLPGSEGRAFVAKCATPGQAKRAGRKFPVRGEWDEIKVAVMLDLNRQKYKDPELRGKLLATEDALLVEGNTWGDRFWGVCNGEGANNLGEILMQIREELRR